MEVMTVFARKVPTLCSVARKYMGASQLAKTTDVQIYRDAECKHPSARFMWDAKNKPTRRNKTVVLNCVRYRLEWV